MSNTLKSFYNFSLFFNLFVFMIEVIAGGSLSNMQINFNLSGIEIDFELNFIVIIISVITILIIGILAGTNVMGSGLNASSTSMLIKVLSYIVLWIILSLFTLTFLSPLGLTGQIFYTILTISYAIGILGNVTEEGNSND